MFLYRFNLKRLDYADDEIVVISTQEAAGNFLVENQTLVVAEPLPTLMKAPSSAPLDNILM